MQRPLRTFIISASSLLLIPVAPVTARDSFNPDIFSTALFNHMCADETRCVQDLVLQYLDDQHIFTYIAPPSAGFNLFQPGRVLYVPDKNDFSREFVKGLVSSTESGAYSAFVWIYEDAESPGRELVIKNDYDAELARVAREEGYSPDWVVNKIYPGLELYPAAYRDYLRAIFDPARIYMRYALVVGEKDLQAFADEKALAIQLTSMQPVTMSIPASQSVTNLMFTVMEPQTNNTVKLTIGWPDSGLPTNKLEIFTCENLKTGVWSVADTETIDLSTNRHDWIDSDGYTNRQSRFYHCFTLEDDDGDGITDGRESLIYGTSPNLSDTDGDELSDYVELFDNYYSNIVYGTVTYSTDPNNADSDGDGLTDKEEQDYGTDPWRSDSDGDSLTDPVEATNYYFIAWGSTESSSYIRKLPSQPVALEAFLVNGDRGICLMENGGVVELSTSGYYKESPGFATNLISVAVGGGHRSAVTGEGELVSWWSWATDTFQNESYESPVKQVVCGWDHTAALLTNGTVRSFYYGNSSYKSQTNQPPGMANATAIAAGNNHTLALLGDGRVIAWGYNNYGQTNVPVNVTNAIAVAAGENHSAAILSDGSVSVWGYSNYNLINNAFYATNAVELSCGKSNCIIRRSDNSVFAWGQYCGAGYKTNMVFNTPVMRVRGGTYGCSVILENGKTFMIYVRHPDYLRTKDCLPVGNGNAVALAATNPLTDDTDGDGMPDDWELEYDFNPFSVKENLSSASYSDPDGDGVTNLLEYVSGTSPRLKDTDDDNIEDFDEIFGPTDPLDPDTDDDGILDGDEAEYGTDPVDPDTDDDTLLDGDEVYTYFCSPLWKDSDNDGLYDNEEIETYGTTPMHPDTDDDGLPDPWEIYYGFNPLVWDDSSIDSDGDGITDKQESNIFTVERTTAPLAMGMSSSIMAISSGFDTGLGWSLIGYSPFLADTDWDGTLDPYDLDATDYLRKDVANNNTAVHVTLIVGDYSGSHSERYSLSVGPYRVHMPHVNNQSFKFEASYMLARGRYYSGAVTSLQDDPEGERTDDGDYNAYVFGSGLVITPEGVLGGYPDTGFNFGSKYFSVLTPEATVPNTAADSASKDGDKADKADPVNAISGNVTVTRTDAALNCPGLPLTFTRYYNSSTLFGGGPLGPGWSHSYEIRLGDDETNTIYKAASGTIRRLHLPDGRTYAFSKSNGVYTAADDIELDLESYGVDQWSVSRPGGFEWIFDSDGRISSMDDGQGNTLTLTYLLNTETGVKYVSEVEHSNGAAIYFAYTNDVQRSVFLLGMYSDDLNWEVAYGYDGSGRLASATRYTQSDGDLAESYLYEDTGFCLTQRVNAAGTTFNYTYTDVERNGVEQRYGASTWLDDNAYRTDFLYHPNAVSNCTRITYHRSDDETTSSLLTWDEDTWQVTSEINEEDGSGYEISYDEDNNLVREAIFENGVTSSVIRAYDSRHNILQEAATVGAVPVYTQNATHYQWHPTLSLPLNVSDSEAITKCFAWSSSGLLLKAYDQISTNTFGYTVNGQIAAVTNANGHVTSFSYDALGHPYTFTPAAGPAVRTLYNASGWLTNSALPALGGGWRETIYQNDTFGRVKSVTYPDGITEYIYRNGSGIITSTVDRAGNRAVYTYEAGNKLTSVTNWLDASTPVGVSFNYDWQLNNLTVVNPMGEAVETYVLDAQERVAAVTNLEGQQLDITYLVGNLVSSIDRFDGVVVSNVYDSAGNVVQTLHDGISIEQATYRKNSQISTLSNAVATVEWNYDVRGLVTNVVQSTGISPQSSVSYLFDPAGNTTGVELKIDNGELRIEYGYDEAERLALQNDGAGDFTYEYHSHNGALGTLSNENIKVDYAYDILDAVTNTIYRDGNGGTIAIFDYQHDLLGLITQKITVVDGTATTNSYTYDNLGRLTSEQVNTDAAVSYTYDLAGNRLSAGGSNFTYTHNKLDSAYHDAAGNITNMVRNGVTLDLTWNTQGQLTSVSTNGVLAESYTWGPLGNRLSTSNAAGVVFHAYDGDHCIVDYTASGDLIASYTWGSGIDNLLSVTVYGEATTNTYYAIKDHLNSVHALIDTTGEVVWSCSYSAWGTPQNSQLSIINSQFQLCYLFQGREYSPVTGLYNFRARWYDSKIGRWLSKDPIGLEGGLNLYVFCGNNPVNFVDPFGEWGFDAKSSHNYWGKVAVSGFDRGGASGYVQAAGASLMQAFIDFWRARSIQNNAEKSGHYSAQEGCEKKALKHGALAVGQIGVEAWGASSAMKAARYSTKLAVHGPHHSFGKLGKRRHLQLNIWQKGVRGSGKAFRVPF